MNKYYGVLIVAVVVALLSGCCGLVPPAVRPVEMSQREYAAAGHRAGATLIVVNSHQATNADVYIYPGRRNKNELLLNIDGKSVVLKEYLDHFWVMNAVHSQRPTVEKRLLDVNTCYTALRVVHWGMAGDYAVDVYQFCTTTDSTQQYWRDRFGRQYYGNVVMVLPGTDQAAMRRLNPVIDIYLHK